jgi:heterokaryon incompatibility protein Het-C
MRPEISVVAAIVIFSMATSCFGFGTGSHFDLTRTVLTERQFREMPLEIVQVENWLTDYYSNSPTYSEKRREVLEKMHFDNLFNEDQVKRYWSILLRNLKTSTEQAARKNDQLEMLVTLGIGLHAVQDFYSHSNWVELHPPANKGEFRSDTYWSVASSQPSASFKELHTGKFPSDRTSGPGPDSIPIGVDLHGSYTSGMNKDSPPRRGWDEAYVFAYAASHELVATMEKWADDARPGFWRSVRELTVDTSDAEKLRKDVAAARDMSMWFDEKGQDGNWKGPGSGSTRFFAAFSSKWVTADSSRYVKALRDGHIQDGLTADLYTHVSAPELPTVEPYFLRRTAVLIKITYTAESKESNWLKRQLPSTGGPDFYTRITAGEQEFWGRTMQHSRQSIDPWFEIAIVDSSSSELPVKISVWDEDDIDPLKDEHIDINPMAGSFDLKTIFNIPNGSCSGDISGIFNSPNKAFSSEGAKPEKRRAIVRGYFVAEPIKLTGLE